MSGQTTYAVLRLVGDQIDPEHVTGIIGFQPTASWKKAARHTVVCGCPQHVQSETVRKTGCWEYSSQDLSASADCNVHLDFIEKILIGAPTSWEYSKTKMLGEFFARNKFTVMLELHWSGSSLVEEPGISRSLQAILVLVGGKFERCYDIWDDELVIDAPARV